MIIAQGSKIEFHWKVIGHTLMNPEWAYLDQLETGKRIHTRQI